MKWIIAGLMVALPFAGGSVAHAQSSPKEPPTGAQTPLAPLAGAWVQS